MASLGRIVLLLCLVAALAMVAVPFGPCHRCSERRQGTMVIASLQNLNAAQAQFVDRRAIDLDDDGVGEFGSFPELAGAVIPRGANACLQPPVLSPSFTHAPDGIVTRSDYLYRIYLPTRTGWSALDSAPALRAVDADRAEREWRAFAWPAIGKDSTQRAFFTDQSGDVWACDNLLGWIGRDDPPPVGAADSRVTHPEEDRPLTGWYRVE